MTVTIFKSTSIKRDWLWYDFGDRRAVTGIGACPVLRNTVQNTGGVLWLPLDLVPAGAGDKEPSSQTEGKHSRIPVDRYFSYFPPGTTQPPVDPPPIEPPDGEPVEPPVVIPPPVEPPPVEPPPVVDPPIIPTTKYKIKTITRTKDFPTVVFFGVAYGLPGKLVSPGGYRVQNFVTGNKPEHGAGGTEAGAGVVAGDHILIIGDDKFTVPVNGEFTKIEFESVTGTEPEPDAVVCTGFMDVSKAQRVLAVANEIARRVVGKDVFRVE